jgi:hypothetical protein
MPRRRNIEGRLNEIAQSATNWLGKFGGSGEIKLIKREEREARGRLFWGCGCWRKPDFIFVHKGTEVGVFVGKKMTVRTYIGGEGFVEERLFGKTCYLARDGICLPFHIDFPVAFRSHLLNLLKVGLIDFFRSRFDRNSWTIVVNGKAKNINFVISVENIDKAQLEINQQLILLGDIVEVFRQLTRLVALANL